VALPCPELVLFAKKNFAIANSLNIPRQTKPGETGRRNIMRNVLAKLTGNPWLLKRVMVLVTLVAVGAGAFYLGKRQAGTAGGGKDDVPLDIALQNASSGGSNRVAAYLFDQPVSREEFGEYLIPRVGRERLDFMLNRKIVEIECRKRGVFATDSEVEQRFLKDLGSFGTPLTREEFVNSILKRFNKTEYEWKEDVIRPKLMMEKLVRPTVKITDKEIEQGFEARYGPRVDCRMIVLDRDNAKLKTKIWDEARKSRANFLEQARKQPIPNLAAEEGKVPPIHRHFGDKALEDAAFALKEGEVSGLIEMKDGSVVMLLCEKHIPANKLVSVSDVRMKLHEELFEMRIAQRIPEVFQEMKRLANPRNVLMENPILLTSHTPPPLPSTPSLPELPKTQTIDIPPPPTPGAVVLPKGLTAAPVLPDAPLPAPKNIAPPMPTPEAKTPPMPMPMPEAKTPPMPEAKKN
jgi:hypothetical protein